jgi:transposase-like protein
MSKRIRRKFSTEQKVAIVRRHLVDKVPISDLCDEYRIQPSMFYDWQRRLLDNLALAFDAGKPSPTPPREQQLEARLQHLEAKLARKDEVIAEISAEYVQLKKELGEP